VANDIAASSLFAHIRDADAEMQRGATGRDTQRTAAGGAR